MNSNQLLVDKAPKIQAAVKMIVHWVNRQGNKTHCLVRIFKQDSAITVIASEIRSKVPEEYEHRGIGHEIPAIADQLYQEFPHEMAFSADKVVWVEHYGDFSNFSGMENDDTERFHETYLRYEGEKIDEIKENTYKVLTSEQVEERLGHLDIKNVYDDLDEIGWTRHIAGVRYSEKALQILAAREAETGSQYL
jgi:hypothetical protein